MGPLAESSSSAHTRVGLQGLAAVRAQTVAGVFWKDFRYLHQAVEVSAATQASAGHQVWTEEVADWRNCFQNRTAVLSLLVRLFPMLPWVLLKVVVVFSLRTSETNYLNEAYSFYAAIRGRAYYSRAAKEDRYFIAYLIFL